MQKARESNKKKRKSEPKVGRERDIYQILIVGYFWYPVISYEHFLLNKQVIDFGTSLSVFLLSTCHLLLQEREREWQEKEKKNASCVHYTPSNTNQSSQFLWCFNLIFLLFSFSQFFNWIKIKFLSNIELS